MGEAAMKRLSCWHPIASLDPHAPFIAPLALEAAMGRSLSFQRAAIVLIGAFALIALSLSVTGRGLLDARPARPRASIPWLRRRRRRSM
jgi:hypothetical protein